MASTSSSSMASQEEYQVKKYDVFVSFRGEDVRYGFLSHLSAALRRKKIMIFIDDKLEKGEIIPESLLKAIEDSKLSIIIFSQNFASSTWCLEEVAEIIRCRKRMGQMVVPVFYHVDPSNVRKQSGNFADAFAGHEEKHNKEKVEKWKSTLTEAGNISGWHQASATTSEHELVEDIVGAVLKKLNGNSSGDTKSLVGMDYHIKQMESLLCVGKDDVYMSIVGIWGMGGIGKTTVAEAIFHRVSSQFEQCCFLANVREEWEKYGRDPLQGKFLSAVLEDENLIKASSNMGRNIFIRDRLRRSKVLIVLDDVSNVEQLESLAVEPGCFGLQSRIIITTRDRQVLQGKVDEMYEIKGLGDSDALHLFSQHAFKRNHPTEDFEEFSKRVVKYADGNPLALKVIGCALLFKSKKIWESALNKLEKFPPDEIQGKLRISYDALGKEERRIFLDIACFFKGDNTDDVTRILDCCGFHTQFGLSNLVDKSLIYVRGDTIWMHDLLQQMARAIVFDESEQPGKRSRLWIPEETSDVLRKNKGTKAIEGIILDVSRLNDVYLPAKTFERMEKLRVLKIYNSKEMKRDGRYFSKIICKVHISQGLDCLPEELQCLWWHRYPLKSLPSNFNPENLVDLDLRCSDLEELWNGIQDLPNLKVLNLSYCQRLIKTPDFSASSNLMRINLEGCTGLIELHPSIWALDNLSDLNLGKCKEVRSFPESIYLKSLKTLTLTGCSNLMKFPEILEKMECLEKLYLDETAIEEVPSSIGNLTGLWSLVLKSCKRLKSLPSNICQLESLKYLYLDCCSELESLPSSICQMNSLSTLSLSGCSKLKSFPEIFKINLKVLNLRYCQRLIKTPDFSASSNLMRINLEGCTGLIELHPSIWALDNLSDLNLGNCKEVRSFPESIYLKSLKTLTLTGCSNLMKFPEILEKMECLGKLYLDETAIEEVPSSIGNLTGLWSLVLKSCKRLKSLPSNICQLESLKYLYLDCCSELESLPSSICQMNSLSTLSLSGCSKLESFPEIFKINENLEALHLDGTPIIELPSSIDNLIGLRELKLHNCKSLATLPSSIVNLTTLQYFSIPEVLQCLPCSDSDQNSTELLPCYFSGSRSLTNQDPSSCNLLQVPRGLCHLISLRELKLSGSDIVSIPPCIKLLSHLGSLFIENCQRLQSLSELPPSVEMVEAYNCTQLKIVTFPSELFFNPATDQVLNFKNCLELDQDQCINKVIRRIKPKSTSVLEFLNQQRSPGLHLNLCVLVPESSEVLEWFSNQSMGSSVTVQLPPDRLKCSFMQFSVCALLECKGEISNFRRCIKCKCTINNEFGNRSFDFEFYASWMSGSGLLMSDHMFLGYGALVMKEWPNKCYPTEALFQFSVGGVDCKVKKCGVDLVCPRDKKDNNPTVMEQTMSCQNFGEPMLEDSNVKDFHDDCSEEPNPKRLKVLEFY